MYNKKEDYFSSFRYSVLTSLSISSSALSVSSSLVISSQGSSSSSIAILTLVSPTISTPSSFSISTSIALPFSLADMQLGPFRHLTIISLVLLSVDSFWLTWTTSV